MDALIGGNPRGHTKRWKVLHMVSKSIPIRETCIPVHQRTIRRNPNSVKKFHRAHYSVEMEIWQTIEERVTRFEHSSREHFPSHFRNALFECLAIYY